MSLSHQWKVEKEERNNGGNQQEFTYSPKNTQKNGLRHLPAVAH
jgi:hypothetical protein